MVNKSAQVDVWKAYKTPVEIVQYEGDGRVINFVLTSNGQAVNLTASTVVFYAEKPSGAIVYNNCSITDAAAGKASYTITTQTCLESGTLNCFIEITTADPTVLRTQTFEITVTESDDVSGAVESTSEFTELTYALALTTGFDARITQNESDISDNAANIATNTSDIADKVDGAGTVTDGHIAQFDGTDGKTIKGGKAIVTSMSSPGSDDNVPTEKAIVDYAAIVCEVTGPGSSTDTSITIFDGTSGNALKEATDAASNPILENTLRTVISASFLLSYRNIGGAL